MSKKTNIAYITPEYPFENITVPLCMNLAKNNVHIIELGVPFSDPLADGPTIQASSFQALQKNVNLDKIFKMVTQIRRESQVGIVLMSYLNPLLSHGLEKFIDDAEKSGIDGVIIPDLPVDELNAVDAFFHKSTVDLVLLAAPTSTRDRLEKIASNSRGFIYCVTLTGVTGAREKSFVNADTIRFLKEIKAISKQHIAVGFGLSQYQQLAALRDYTDGFIIGSALIKNLEQGKDSGDSIQRGIKFIQNVYRD